MVKIKRFKIDNLKVILTENKELITTHYKKLTFNYSASLVGGYYSKREKKITTSKEHLIHELIHHYEYCLDYYILKENDRNGRGSLRFNFFKNEEKKLKEEFFYNIDYLEYRLQQSEILAHEFAHILKCFQFNNTEDFIQKIKLLKMFYPVNTFEGLYLRILVRHGFFKTLYRILKEIEDK